MNPCQRYRGDIFDLADGELDSLRKKELEAHLNSCIECARFLRQVRKLRSSLCTLPSLKTTENFTLFLRENIRRELAGRQRRSIGIPPLRHLAPAFGLLALVVAAGVWIFDQRNPGEPSLYNGLTGRDVAAADTASGNSVRYVIDQYREETVSEAESPSGIPDEDSLQTRSVNEDLRRRLAPVSF